MMNWYILLQSYKIKTDINVLYKDEKKIIL